MNLHEIFESFNDEFLEFDRVENKRSKCKDIHAFLLLEEIMDGQIENRIISGIEYEEYFLSVDCDELAKRITRDQVIELTRCGVRYSDNYDCLAMFV